MSESDSDRGFPSICASILGAIAFYTAIPLPPNWKLELNRIARWCPWTGILLGVLLNICDLFLDLTVFPVALRSGLVITVWVLLTGGLHLDGAIDTADGLAVTDIRRQLDAMKDSTVGAFGTIAAVGVLGLKTLALTELTGIERGAALLCVPLWGRWGQLLAIAAYPYLRPAGKGRFHREALVLPWDLAVGTLPGLGLLAIAIVWQPQLWTFWLGIGGGGSCIAWAVGAALQRWLGGQTGDTYGAIVEWTEALLLCLLTSGLVRTGG